MVIYNQQNSTNPWVGWTFSVTNLTLNKVSYNQQNSINPINPWVGGVLFLVVTEHIQDWAGLG
jgi:hypothetical protein